MCFADPFSLRCSPQEDLRTMGEAIAACLHCKCKPEVLQRCSGCKVAFYCGAACQKADWKTHRLDCIAAAEGEEYQQMSDTTEVHHCTLLESPTPDSSGDVLPQIQVYVNSIEIGSVSPPDQFSRLVFVPISDANESIDATKIEHQCDGAHCDCQVVMINNTEAEIRFPVYYSLRAAKKACVVKPKRFLAIENTTPPITDIVIPPLGSAKFQLLNEPIDEYPADVLLCAGMEIFDDQDRKTQWDQRFNFNLAITATPSSPQCLPDEESDDDEEILLWDHRTTDITGPDGAVSASGIPIK